MQHVSKVFADVEHKKATGTQKKILIECLQFQSSAKNLQL